MSAPLTSANKMAGEVAVQWGDTSYVLCLTLGAWARIQQRCGDDIATGLAALSASDVAQILADLIVRPAPVDAAHILALPISAKQALDAMIACFDAAD